MGRRFPGCPFLPSRRIEIEIAQHEFLQVTLATSRPVISIDNPADLYDQ